jgi:predicted nucleic acid-binding protein
MADVLLDSDVVIWHLRGRTAVTSLVADLAARSRLGVSAVSRAEVLQGARPAEMEATLRFLDACETMPVDARVADLAARLVRDQRAKGVTIHLPDALIAATALAGHLPIRTCNVRHYPFPDVAVHGVNP